MQGDLIMTYFVEIINYDEQYITVDARPNLKSANQFARFLRDHYNVDVEVYTEEEYLKTHPAL